MLDGPVLIPIRIRRLQAVKVNNLSSPCPARIVFKIVRQKIIAIIRDHGNRVSLSHCQRIQDELVRAIEFIGDDALEILQVVLDLSTTEIKARSLNGEHTRVDPARNRFHRFLNAKEIRLPSGRTPGSAAIELIGIYESDIG